MLTLKPFTNVTPDMLPQTSLLEAFPHGCCGVRESAALAQLLEIGKFGQDCRINREMGPKCLCNEIMCMLCTKDTSSVKHISWGLLCLHQNKSLCHEAMASGFGSLLFPGEEDTTLKAALWYPHIYHMETSVSA